MKKAKSSILHEGNISYVVPFILITSCFALWGFANDITNPMVKAFSKIFRMSVTEGTLVQVAFYGGYFAMAFPAAMFIRKYTYKAGVMLGLGLYAFGAFLFYPAMLSGMYFPFLIAYFILTCGLSFLETSSNPYILSMGSEETATRRLNLAQAFNPIGSLLGMYVAMNFIQNQLHPMDTAERALLDQAEFEAIRDADLQVLIGPYVLIGLVILVMLIVIRLAKMPVNKDQNHNIDFIPTLKRIFQRKHYREGVITQFFYVGAQIMCWTFIIQYGTHLFTTPSFHHPHGHGGAGSRSAVTEVQHRGHGPVLRQPLHLHLPAALPQCGQPAEVAGRGGLRIHSGCHPLPEHLGYVLPGGRVRLYVAHVPHHLRHRAGTPGR